MVLFIIFGTLQGLVVFLTAFLARRLLRKSGWLSKILSMTAACVFWIVGTLAAYVLLGGDGGLMDGFGLLLVLFFNCCIASAIVLAIWLTRPDAEMSQD